MLPGSYWVVLFSVTRKPESRANKEQNEGREASRDDVCTTVRKNIRLYIEWLYIEI